MEKLKKIEKSCLNLGLQVSDQNESCLSESVLLLLLLTPLADVSNKSKTKFSLKIRTLTSTHEEAIWLTQQHLIKIYNFHRYVREKKKSSLGLFPAPSFKIYEIVLLYQLDSIK